MSERDTLADVPLRRQSAGRRALSAALEKRTIDLDGELRSLHALLNRQERPVELDAESASALVEVFASWVDLTRNEKRLLLRDFGVRVAVERPRRRLLHVARVEVRSLDGLCLYKKIEGLGIQRGGGIWQSAVRSSGRVPRPTSPTRQPLP